MKRGPENPELLRAIHALEKTARARKAPVYERLAALGRKPTRQRPEVNLYKLSRLAQPGRTLVTYKVLSLGTAKKIDVAAFAYTKAARTKIEKAGGHAWNIQQLLQSNPDGSNVHIVV